MRSLLTVVAVSAMLAAPLTFAQQYPNRDDNQGYRPPANDRYQAQNVIPSGTRVEVRTDDRIDARDRADNRIYRGTIAEDVHGQNGNVLIPRGANVELIVRDMGSRDLTVDLESVTVNGRRYMVNAAAYDRARSEGVGENKRTGKYVGGGALLGTIVGAIAGGGKGAAIGALAGAGAGAGTETLTRGHALNIPSESVLTFRLDQPLELARGPYSQDRGYDRNGYHYHDNYYHRDENGNDDQNR